MNNYLTTAMGPSELNAKERKIRLVTIVVAVLTWNDPQGMTIPMPYFQSYSLFLLAAGIGFVVLGWIFRLALRFSKKTKGSFDGDRCAIRCHAGAAQNEIQELAEAIGLSEQNLSALRSGKARGVRFSTLSAICDVLECQPGDLLEFVDERAEIENFCRSINTFCGKRSGV